MAGSEAESGEDFVARFDARVDVSSTSIVACFWEAGVRSFRVRLGMAFCLSSCMASESTDIAERWVEPAPAWVAAVPCGLSSGFGTAKNSGTVGGPGGQSFRCFCSKRRIAASAALARASSAALESVHAGRGSGCGSWGWGAARLLPPSVPRPTRDWGGGWFVICGCDTGDVLPGGVCAGSGFGAWGTWGVCGEIPRAMSRAFGAVEEHELF